MNHKNYFSFKFKLNHYCIKKAKFFQILKFHGVSHLSNCEMFELLYAWKNLLNIEIS